MSLYGAFAEATRRGESIERGVAALDGANPTPITTSFKSISAVLLQLAGSAAPGVGTSILTYAVSGKTVNVYAWKVTSSADTTLVASTGTESFSYVIVGKK